MNYNDLIQLYFERSTAMQEYWNLYVVVVGGLLAFSSLRKRPAPITTLIVSLLFALFAYENLDAMYDTTRQRFATIEAIKQLDSTGTNAGSLKQVRDLLEPTLTPATYGSVRTTHVISDILTIAALWAMEFRRRRLRSTMSAQ
jgi:TctA family transporter